MRIFNTTIIFLFLFYFPINFFATGARVTQLFITNQQEEYRHVFLYNSPGKVQLETTYILENNTWVRQNQTEWFYEGENCIKQVERIFENGIWQNVNEVQSLYNRLNHKTMEQISGYVDGEKIPFRKISFEYSAGILSKINEYIVGSNDDQLAISSEFFYNDGKVIQQITKNHLTNTSDSAYVLFFTYDTGGNIKTQLVKNKIQDEYVNTDSITWFYNSDGTLASQRSKVWSEKNQAWENSQLINYEYDAASNLISETYQQWSGMYWENAYRYEYIYDNNVQTKRTLMTQLYREWRNVLSINYSDFVDNRARLIESEYDFWGGNQGELTQSYIPFLFNDELVIRKAESIRVNYDNVFISTDIDGASINIHVYPNPSDGVFYVSTEKCEILSWTVYNLKGQNIRSHIQKDHTGVIDITDVVNGVYILYIQTTVGDKQFKLIKQ